ncbi:MAG TPA: crotonase/enoyl-CoA hydratase family protein [Acidimicrobiales bacterium]|nr:crotonase/enoyl-CoA hydratase family protein [Acidimicrobiales bacterium]
MTTSDPVTTTIEDGVAVLRFDDGKANALSFAAVAGLAAGLDRAAAEAEAVCLVGRDGKLCAGFDLSVMEGGPDAARELVAAGGELLMRLYGHPQPVVVAVTGHALAAGALLVLACDVRIGADADPPAKIGLNETSIGMPLPLFALALAEDRLARRSLVAATLAARIYSPAEAVEVGYLDAVVPPGELEAAAVSEARRLATYSRSAYARTKEVLRGPTLERVRRGGAADLAHFAVEPRG